MSEDKIHELPNLNRDELKASVEMLKRNIETWLDWGKQMARIRRAHYDAYILEGFTPEQALILCQKLTL